MRRSGVFRRYGYADSDMAWNLADSCSAVVGKSPSTPGIECNPDGSPVFLCSNGAAQCRKPEGDSIIAERDLPGYESRGHQYQ